MRFAWLSGNCVDPEFRRKGFSTRLLQQAEALWDGRLMYTNYAPASKAVYDRTGQFPLLLKERETLLPAGCIMRIAGRPVWSKAICSVQETRW